jgi:hypothetical protein
VQPSRPFRCAPRVGDTPPLAVATPHLRQEAFGMYVTAAANSKATAKANAQGGSAHEHHSHRRSRHPVHRHR